VYPSANTHSLPYETPGKHASINNVLCMQFSDVVPNARVDAKAGNKSYWFDGAKDVK
jgi:hypothetical protein